MGGRAMLRNAFYATLDRVSLRAMPSIAGVGVLLPLYHSVYEKPPAHVAHLGCWRRIDEFRADLDLLLRVGRPVGLGDVVAHINGRRKLPARAFHLTVDDGLRESAELIADICLRKGVPATFFLTSGFLDNHRLGYRHLASVLIDQLEAMPAHKRAAIDASLQTLFTDRSSKRDAFDTSDLLHIGYEHRQLLERAAEIIEFDISDYLTSARPYLQRLDVLGLMAKGFTVGAHSVDHPPFAEISRDEQVRQVVESVRAIDAWFAPAEKTFAFPFSAKGAAPGLFQLVSETLHVDVYFGTGHESPSAAIPVMGRVPMESRELLSAAKVLKNYFTQNIVRRVRAGGLGHAATSSEQTATNKKHATSAIADNHTPCSMLPAGAPLVSILIPCYNAEQWVGQAIESSLAQTWPNKEVIVVDDGSTDGSLEIIRSFGERIRWEAGPNRGGNRARNRLLELASGEWLQYLDADDYLLPDKIAGQLADEPAYPRADLLYSPMTLEFWRDGRQERRELLSIPKPHDLWVLLARWQFPGTHAVLLRRTAVIAAGGWKPDQPCCQEHELFVRLLKEGCRFAYCPRPGAIYRQWSDATVCKRTPLLSISKRLEILSKLESLISTKGMMTPDRMDALAQSRLECARTMYQYDPEAAISVVRRSQTLHPKFRVPRATAFPAGYRVAYRAFGFAGAERLAAGIRSIRKPAAAHGQPVSQCRPASPPLVSILIPCYNAEAWIGQAIDSALVQSWPNKEVIVLDDGSTDRSLEIVRSFGDRIRWESGPNRGGNSARNRLLKLSNGQWLQYLDADDYLLPEKIKSQLDSELRQNGADVIFSPSRLEYWKDGRCIREETVPLADYLDPWVMLARWMLPNTTTVLWRRQAIEEVGGWKEGQPCCQEHELYFRLLQAGKQFHFCKHAGAVYRQWSDMTVCKRNPLLSFTKRIEILDSAAAFLESNFELIGPRMDAIAHGRLECARGIYRFNRDAAIACASRALQQHPNFRLPHSACFPPAYRMAFRAGGFESAERLATWARNWRNRQPNSPLQDHCPSSP
jgi:glycosyltransferase involved in cell wall biosynthesis/peptidoglycan/xylan/chitin deacetylase (PgdA/CDA1 family)